MNKKIIAIAIASALTAPAAMADVTVSGQIGAAYISASKGYLTPTAGNSTNKGDLGQTLGSDAYRTMEDNGLSQLNFSGNSGNAVFKIGMDIRGLMQKSYAVGRDFWLGYKFNAGTLSFGRMPAALAGLEGDKYNATFLELRRTAAVATTWNESTDTYYTSPIAQWAMKAGGADIKVQFDPADKTSTSGTEGYYAVSVKGQAGAIGYFAGVNNGQGKDTGTSTKEQNTKLGASMKFGAVKATLMAMNSDDNTDKNSAITIMADMDMGSGTSAGVAFGTQTSGANNKDTFMRLALNKQLDKATRIFGGYVAKRNDDATANKDTNALGVGMAIKF